MDMNSKGRRGCARRRLVLAVALTAVFGGWLAGCAPGGGDEQGPSRPLSEMDVSKESLSGTWVIEPCSLTNLWHAGYRKYLRRTDHVIVLKRDGSSIYRTYDGVESKVISTEKEDDLYLRYRGSDRWRTWYVWDLESDEPIQGPFAEASSTGGVGKAWLPNHFRSWRLYDQEREGLIQGRNLPRYWVWMFNNPDHSAWESVNYWRIGKDDQGVFLYGRVHLLGEIRFGKKTLAEFRSLIAEEQRADGVPVHRDDAEPGLGVQDGS